MDTYTKDLTTKRTRLLFALLLLLKIILACVFSSDFQNKLFIPFVSHFLTHFDNPWNYFYIKHSMDVFPYSPLMLYILSFFYAPIHYLGISSPVIQNIFFKIPTLIADLTILFFLFRLSKNVKYILFYYFATPIIIYACYMHAQLDLIPTALLFLSVSLLTNNKITLSAIIMGLAISTKSHVLAAFPFMCIFVLKKYKLREFIKFVLLPPTIYLLFIIPYLGEGFSALVLNNPKQQYIYKFILNIGGIKIYMTFLIISLLYARYFAFRKTNNDLLYTFLALGFSVFLILTSPSPAWYVWLFPFISIFYIKNGTKNPAIMYLYIAINICFLLYMVFFHYSGYRDLFYLGTPLNLKINSSALRDLSFTFLEAVLIANAYAFYRFGIRSNFVYKKDHPIIIGIAGNSGAGKTTTLSALKMLLGEKALQLEGDAEHKWERDSENWKTITHLDPKANLLYRQYENLVKLKYGRTIFRQDYDHTDGKFTYPKKLKSNDYIILSGLHAFYLPKMRKIIDMKIYLDTDENVRAHWQILRDTDKRGHSKEEILESIRLRSDDAKKHITPQKDFADIILHWHADKAFTIGEVETSPKVKLSITLEANVPVEEVATLLNKKIAVSWDYSNNLETQRLNFDGWINKEDIKNIFDRVCTNYDELISAEPLWLDGYKGLAQLFILLVISEKVKMLGEGLTDVL